MTRTFALPLSLLLLFGFACSSSKSDGNKGGKQGKNKAAKLAAKCQKVAEHLGEVRLAAINLDDGNKKVLQQRRDAVPGYQAKQKNNCVAQTWSRELRGCLLMAKKTRAVDTCFRKHKPE